MALFGFEWQSRQLWEYRLSPVHSALRVDWIWHDVLLWAQSVRGEAREQSEAQALQGRVKFRLGVKRQRQ